MISSICTRLIHFVSCIFINGFFTLLPIALTFALVSVSFRMVKSWLEPFQALIEGTPFDSIPHVEIIMALAIVFAIGAIMRVFILRSIVHTIEQLIVKIPLVRPIYSSIKQLVFAFGAQDKTSFKKVVIVEYPRIGVYSIGFLTSELPREVSPQPDVRFFSVFIPTTPNPTSGFFVVLKESDVRVIDLNRQEAMALVISGGIILPDRFQQQSHS